MPRYEQRANILQGAGAMIFNMVCERSTPEQWSEWLRVPLEHAASTANADLVDKLLKAGADGSAGWKGCNGQTLLHAGAEGGNERVMSALIRAGAKEDMNVQAGAAERAPLHLAANGEKVAAAKVLVMAGADVNLVDAHNEGPLHLAIKRGNAALAEMLLLRGADSNLRSSSGNSPIHLAAEGGQDEVVRNLLHAGALANCRSLSRCRYTALSYAAEGNHLSTLKVLLDGEADVTVRGRRGRLPLHQAAIRGNTGIIAALVEAGADIEARTFTGCTPLLLAVCNGRCSAILCLLRLGADVHAKSTWAQTPLHFACRNGNLDAADLLLRWGADEARLDKDRKTPSSLIPNAAQASEENRPRLERLSRLLASTPQDRAWRRRGMLVLCRAHPDRLRLVVEIPETAEARGPPQGRPSRRARRGQVKVEVTMGGVPNGGGGGAAGSSAGDSGGRRAAQEGDGGSGGRGLDGVAAWLIALREEDVFRKIVGFL